MNWPGPVHEHLDRLKEIAIEDGAEGDGLGRTEILAALVYAAPRTGAELRALLERYRRGLAKDLIAVENNVVAFRVHPPGRR